MLNQRSFVIAHLEPRRHITGRVIFKNQYRAEVSAVAQDLQFVMC